MKIAVMQPYFFPYIGYFQLINAVDKFIFYDDVNFIKQGWINRNRILVNNKDLIFSIPIQNISSYSKINETVISKRQFEKWYSKFIKTIINSYSKAPYFNKVISLIEFVFSGEHNKISLLAIKSVIEVCKYLDLKINFELSSEKYSDNYGMNKADRLIDICKRNNCLEYINPIGGMKIYSKEEFAEKGIDIKFLSTNKIEYQQFLNEFVPNLSIIDVMMFNSIEEIHKMLDDYELI